jgi:hypothetical protein
VSRWSTLRIKWSAFPRWTQALFALAAITLAWWAIDTLLVHFPIRSHPMNEYTQNMKAICVGRYLIDVPGQFKLTGMAQTVNGIEIERLPKEVASPRSFEMESERMGRTLKDESSNEAYHPYGVPISLDSNGRLFTLLRGTEAEGVVRTIGFILRGRSIFKLTLDYAFEDLGSARREIGDLAQRITIRDSASPLTTNGLCIDGGFVSGKGFDQEKASASFEMAGYPGLTFGVTVQRALPPDGQINQKLHERYERAWSFPVLGTDPHDLFKLSRKAAITVNGQEGQELVIVLSEKDAKELKAQAEIYGDGSVERQEYGMLLLNDTHDNIYAPSKKLATIFPDDTALAIWDAVVKSIRPRPGAF